jgi:ABC-type antimicrobial peptide transport system permease subunit
LGSTAPLLVAGFAAAVIPAWRAARLDPLAALPND